MLGGVGYVSVSNSPTVNLKHNQRDSAYMDLEEAAYYSREQKRIDNGTYPPDYEIPPFRIDRSKSYLNETLYEKSLEEVYDENFQSAVDDFDKKQRHKERRKGNYLEYVKSLQTKKTKNNQELKNIPKVWYELVFQIGGSEDSVDLETKQKDGRYHALTEEEKAAAAEALKDFFKDFQKRNPEIAVVGAYLHMDETSPHLHVIYVPVCHSKRGPAVKNNRAGALDEQEQRIFDSMPEGKEKEKFKKEMEVNSFHVNRLTRWQDRERKALQECAFEHGLVVETTPKPTKETHEKIEAFSAKKLHEQYMRENASDLELANKILNSLQDMEESKAELDADIKDKQEQAKTIISDAQEEADSLIADAKQQAEDIAFSAYEERDEANKERDEAIKARDEAIEHATNITTKDRSYNVDMFGNLKNFKESTYDEIIEKQNGYQTKAILDKKTIEEKTAENTALQAENKTLRAYQKAYTDIQKDIPTKADIDKAFDNGYMDNRDISELLRMYSFRYTASERKNILKTLERLDKLDKYLEKSYQNRHYSDNFDILNNTYFLDYKEEIKDMYEKVLDYNGRSEIYEELPKMWEKIQKDNASFWKEYKSKRPNGYAAQVNLDKHFIQSAGNSALQGIKELYAMQEQAQEEYDER